MCRTQVQFNPFRTRTQTETRVLTHDCAAASTYTNTRRDLQFQLHADLRTPPATLLQLQLPDSSAVLSQGHVAWGV